MIANVTTYSGSYVWKLSFGSMKNQLNNSTLARELTAL